MAKRYRVSYYEVTFDKYGDKDHDYYEGWVSEYTLADIKCSRSVYQLEVHEEEEYVE